MSSFFDRDSTIAEPGFNRFLVPPAALAVHLSIGQAYAFSTFNLPLTKLIGLTQSVPHDWNLKDIGWVFSLAIVFLGASAAMFGRWVERVGDRKSTRLNSSHQIISYAVFCLKKKKKIST